MRIWHSITDRHTTTAADRDQRINANERWIEELTNRVEAAEERLRIQRRLSGQEGTRGMGNRLDH